MLECDGRKGCVGEISFCSLVLRFLRSTATLCNWEVPEVFLVWDRSTGFAAKMYFYCKCLQYWFLSTQVLAAECELGSHMFFSRVLAPGRNGPQVLTLQSTLQYFCFSTGVLAPGSCGPHVARCARCGSQGE